MPDTLRRPQTPSPLQPHGTYARATGRPASGIPGCKCPPCAKARRVGQRRANFLRATGRPLTVDATAAVAHLRGLMAGGAGWNQLRAVTGCSTATISELLNETRTRMLRSTETRILAVRLEQVLPEPLRLPGRGTVRRVRALMALGHSPEQIAAAAGCHVCTVTDFAYGRSGEFVRPRTARLIAGAYERLHTRPGDHARSRARAAGLGWVPPLGWDDIDADTAPVRQVASAQRTREQTMEEVRHLAAGGATRVQVAERMGVPWDTITRAFARAGELLPLVLR